VITEVLPPLLEQHGDEFEIIGVNTAETGGQALYQATIAAFSIPQERRGVPTLVIGDVVLVGSVEIPEQLPGLIEEGLAQGGTDWPAIPGLAEALAESAPAEGSPAEGSPAEGSPAEGAPAEGSPTPAPDVPSPTAPTVAPSEATPSPTAAEDPVIPGTFTDRDNWRTRFSRDPLGNGISIVVLVGMLASVVYQGAALTRAPVAAPGRRQGGVPLLVALGLVVAGYLAYVETQQVAAVCGPVGDCNAVQQSEFALLFGFLPIAVLGVLGYIGIGAAWAVARWARSPWTDAARLAMVGMVWFGMAFSIYLTFLEPFVIGATCAWCLTSAVVMTALFWLIAPYARSGARSVGRLSHRDKKVRWASK
jgi:uncharacterized membrane protein